MFYIEQMNFKEFQESLKNPDPPASISPYLEALWHDATGSWEKAHSIVQDIGDSTAAWIHAYLHRREGDTGNADYWYHRAGKERSPASSQAEWEQIVKELINN